MPPLRDRRVVPAQQYLGHFQAAEHPRSGVLRVFEPAVLAVRLVGRTQLVAEHAGDEADHGVDHDHRRHFAAVADEVADRDFHRVQHLPDAVVEPLVPPAQQQQPRSPSPAPRPFVASAARRPGVSITNLPGDSAFACTASTQSITGCGHQHHPGAAAERPVVHPLVLVLRPVADVPGVNLNQAGLDRVFEQALAEVTLEDPGNSVSTSKRMATRSPSACGQRITAAPESQRASRPLRRPSRRCSPRSLPTSS